jgi:hypothetical protein
MYKLKIKNLRYKNELKIQKVNHNPKLVYYYLIIFSEGNFTQSI